MKLILRERGNKSNKDKIDWRQFNARSNLTNKHSIGCDISSCELGKEKFRLKLDINNLFKDRY